MRPTFSSHSGPVSRPLPTAGTAVEAERELVEVGVQMCPTHPTVMGPKQPALEQRDDPVDPREQLGGQGVVSPQVRHTGVIILHARRH